jgi:hypothetical protein
LITDQEKDDIMNIYHIQYTHADEPGSQIVGVCAASATDAARIVRHGLESYGAYGVRLGRITVVERDNQTWEPGTFIRY